MLAAAEEALVQVPAKLIVASPVLADPVADELHSLGVDVDCVFADEVERRRAGRVLVRGHVASEAGRDPWTAWFGAPAFALAR
ncbi:MAG TPA: hypothetical protein VMU49_06965 [Candidatus Acidoferrales bacterium]|nr:hypothetical protein [Candidatus Acidoferrales bacterium]